MPKADAILSRVRCARSPLAVDTPGFAQDDWRAMREAALKEQAAGDSADTPMVDEDVKPCAGELQVARLDLAARVPPPPRSSPPLDSCRWVVARPEMCGTRQVPVEADGSLNFFWIDAYEDINKPGRIYLFGKIRSGEAQGKPAYTSCCLQVGCSIRPRCCEANPKDSLPVLRGVCLLHARLSSAVQVDGIERHAFILPRDKILDCDGNETEVDVDMEKHVLPEFMQIARSKGIKKHQCKPTTRKYMYHFEVRQPRAPAQNTGTATLDHYPKSFSASPSQKNAGLHTVDLGELTSWSRRSPMSRWKRSTSRWSTRPSTRRCRRTSQGGPSSASSARPSRAWSCSCSSGTSWAPAGSASR
jgi:hypothetical protein